MEKKVPIKFRKSSGERSPLPSVVFLGRGGGGGICNFIVFSGRGGGDMQFYLFFWSGEGGGVTFPLVALDKIIGTIRNPIFSYLFINRAAFEFCHLHHSLICDSTRIKSSFS